MKKESRSDIKPSLLSHVLMLLGVIVTIFVLLTRQVALRRTSYSINIGDVATTDITSPSTIKFVSDILTEEAKEEAAKNVSNVYLPADPTISRTQVQNMRYTFQFIAVVRDDEYSTEAQKIADINNISLTRFDEATITELLMLSQDDWNMLLEESIRVLENVMQNSIRDTTLISETENIPAMINYYISQPIANLVTSFVSRFVVANSLYSEELTEQKREEARASVQPRERTYVINQTVLQRGQVVNALTYEALNKMGLVVSHDNWNKYISVFCLLIGLMLYYLISIYNNEITKKMDLGDWTLVSVLTVVYLTLGRLFVPNHTVMPYFFPIQALGLTICSLFGRSLAFTISLIECLLLPYDFNNATNYIDFYIISSFTAIILSGKGSRIMDFIRAGLIGNAVGIPIVVAVQFLNTSFRPDYFGLAEYASVALIGGLASGAIALLSQYVFAEWIGLTTPLKLMEVLRPESPLLQVLLQTAPGTYQHSLQVANLAEQAARDIGADSLLTRAGAMYHDIGKTENPSYFVENQVVGNLNLHEELTPQESAANIIRHTSDGAILIRKYHMPEVLADFAIQHHGTNQTRYQMGQAIKLYGENKINLKDFTYPGPRPQSREVALVMLADTTEARARAERPANDEEIEKMVKEVFLLYNNNGQLDDTSMTMHDLCIARKSFERVLHNLYHPRVRYPENVKESENK